MTHFFRIGQRHLDSAGAERRRWFVLGAVAKYAFCGLKRKRRDFERNVLMYVSIKIPALTHSGRKRRVCVNAGAGLTANLRQGFSRGGVPKKNGEEEM